MRPSHCFHVWHAIAADPVGFDVETFAQFAKLEPHNVAAIVEAFAEHGMLPAAAVKRSDKAIPLPARWHPCPLPDNVAALADLWPPERLQRELDAFRDYWDNRTDSRARKVDWDKAWHNRIRDQHDRVMRETSNGRARTGTILDALARVRDEAEAERAAERNDPGTRLALPSGGARNGRAP